MRFSTLVAFILTCLYVLESKYVVDHSQRVFKDSQGRQRYWHGINIVQKSAPFHPLLDEYLPGLSITKEDIETLLSMGAFVVRLGVMMPGMFPTGPSLNSTYLDVIESIVSRLHDNGIDTILDLHQDVLAPKLCGEGTPDWMLDTAQLHGMDLPRPAAFKKVEINASTGRPTSCSPPAGLLKFIGWSEWYMTDQCGKAFAQLYDGHGVMADAFASYWKEVATRFRGTPGVLAYELLNEPWVGDFVHTPSLLLEAGRAEQEVGKYMQRMHDIVRAADPDTMVLYAPAEVNNRLMRNVGYPAGFLPEAAMAYHVYCLVGTDGDGPTNFLTKELCHFNDGFQMSKREEDLRRLQTAGFVTEFGGVSPSKTGFAEVEHVLDAFDKMQPPTNWAFWDFGEVQRQNATNREAYLKILARAYPRAVAGALRSQHFDSTTGAFEMQYEPSAQGVTEVFLPKRYRYGSGYKVTISPPGSVVAQDTDYGIQLSAGTVRMSEVVTIRVEAKSESTAAVLV